MKHPPFVYHQMISDGMAWGLERAHERDAARGHAGAHSSQHAQHGAVDSLWPAADLGRMIVCDQPLSTYDAFGSRANARAPAIECGTAGPGIASSHCTLMEDVASKPGWVLRREASSNEGASVSFEVSFGRFPTLNVVYLQSFRGTSFGDADLCIYFKGSRPCRPYTLHGQHGGNSTSQTKAEFLTPFMDLHQSSTYGSAGMSGFRVPPFASAVVNLTLRGGEKFKLESLHSC